jgi:hypothetical protein
MLDGRAMDRIDERGIAAKVRGGMNAGDVRRRMCRSTLPSRSAISAND